MGEIMLGCHDVDGIFIDYKKKIEMLPQTHESSHIVILQAFWCLYVV